VRIRKARSPASPEAARVAALRMLERRPHAERELARKLVLRGYERETVDGIVGRLRETGLLDDEKFARDFARWRMSGSLEGRGILAMRLVARGVPRKLAEETAEAAMTNEEEADRAVTAARKYVKRHPADDAAGRRKLYSFLARRGFPPEAIRRAVRATGVTEGDSD